MNRSHPWHIILVAFVISCTPEPPPELTADQWIAAMHRAIGPTADSVASISVRAMVEGPQGEFVTRVASSRDGRVAINLAGSLIAGIAGDTNWLCDPNGNVVPLDQVTRSVVRGHDLHMMVLHPSWLGTAVLDSMRQWGADSVVTLRFSDELGAPLLMHLRRADTIPVAFQLVNHSGQGPREVVVELGAWQVIDGLRLFTEASFVHGGNRFGYDYRDVEINTLSDAAFAASCDPGSDR